MKDNELIAGHLSPCVQIFIESLLNADLTTDVARDTRTTENSVDSKKVLRKGAASFQQRIFVGFEAGSAELIPEITSPNEDLNQRQNYFEQPAQYPPISNRDTTIRNRHSFSTCPFSFSKMSLTNSMILPQRRQAM